jgi:hypothetical protein
LKSCKGRRGTARRTRGYQCLYKAGSSRAPEMLRARAAMTKDTERTIHCTLAGSLRSDNVQSIRYCPRGTRAPGRWRVPEQALSMTACGGVTSKASDTNPEICEHRRDSVMGRSCSVAVGGRITSRSSGIVPEACGHLRDRGYRDSRLLWHFVCWIASKT